MFSMKTVGDYRFCWLRQPISYFFFDLLIIKRFIKQLIR